MIGEYIRLIRPNNWYKNIVIFVCLVFSDNIFKYNLWLDLIFAFIILCLLSGSSYIINDILDVNKDKNHPIKKKRPIASGKIKINHAIIYSILLIFLSLVGAYFINISFLIISIVFLSVIFLYSTILKKIIIIDTIVISIGFVIRAIAGCLVISVLISPWLIICAFLVSLFLALGKRRHELILLGKDAKNHRKILSNYSSQMLDQLITITTATLVMSYSLYTFMADSLYMMITIPIVIYGLYRYLFLIHIKNFGGEPEMLFKDKGMLLSMIFWTILVFFILYIFPKINLINSYFFQLELLKLI